MEPANKDRADRADEALSYYVQEQLREAVYSEESLGEHVTDLLSDMMHFCQAKDIDLDQCLRMAKTHYEAESGESSNATEDISHSAMSLIKTIARMTMDGEEVEDGEKFIMENDDAYDTLNNLISKARECVNQTHTVAPQPDVNHELLAALELLHDTGTDSTMWPYAMSKASKAIAQAKTVAQQPTINQELLEACIQARAALPDAWAAVQCDTPKEVIELLNRAIERAESVEPTPINLAIVLDGGLVQAVVTDAPEAFKGVNAMIIDYDVDAPSVEDDSLGIVPQGDGNLKTAYIYATTIENAGIDLARAADFVTDRAYGANQERFAICGENPCEGCKDCNSDGERCVNEDKCLAWQYYNND